MRLVSSTTSSFTGSVPMYYDRCLGPVLFEPYAADLARRLGPGDGLRVLEVACGTGIVTRRLRDALADSATLTATDLNEPMLAYARSAVPAPGIDWRTADGQALPFDDAAFDALVFQFGLMFLPNRAQGFREARRVLAPGGRLLANVWLSKADNPYVETFQAALDRLFPGNAPRFFDTPHGYYDADRLRADMAAGGWDQVHLEDVRLQSISPSATALATGFVRGSPLTHELTQRGADLDDMVRELATAVSPGGGEVPFTAKLAATVITATR
jgi:SAM-dependent methyltransferase